MSKGYLTRLATLIAVAFSLVTAHAQRQGNIWYFGNYAGLNFNSGSPVPSLDGAMTTTEGCATICDKYGNLLFYTNGIDVWNRNHVLMPNGTGLMGDPSSTQCGVIVPKPSANPDTFYVFSVDNHGGPNGFRYSIVDMTLNGGLGAVQAGAKNVPLLTPTTEKVTAVRHANQKDIWVITHHWTTNRFYAYLVDNIGLNLVPVISSTGSIHGPPGANNSMGYMKVSPEGDKIACAIYGQNRVEIFDFNNATGVVSNPGVLQLPSWQFPYGIEFSPSSQYLYTTTAVSKEVHQFDMWAGGAAAIQASAVSLGTFPSGGDLGALQLARDGKIYNAIQGSPSLGVIHNPNVGGVACNYVYNGQTLGGRVSFYGLPTFVQSFFAAANFDAEFICDGDFTRFYLKDTTNIDSVFWEFGDPGSGPANYSTLMEPLHQYPAPGVYTVTLIFHGNNITDTISRDITIHPRANLNLGNDTVICYGATFLLDATNPDATYLWSDSSTGPTFLVTGAGTYWVEVTNFCDTLTDAILVTYAPVPVIDLGPDTAICNITGTVLLDATYPDATYLWHDSSATATYLASGAGAFYVEVDNGCDAVSDTIEITYIPPLTTSLGNDTVVCPSETVELTAEHIGSTYLWSTGSQAANISVSITGTYWVVVTNVCESLSDTVNIDAIFPPTVNLGPDTTICTGASLFLDAYYPSASYAWGDGGTYPSITVDVTGTYSVTVTNECGYASDYLILKVLDPPVAALTPDTTICPGTLNLSIQQQEADVLWSNGSSDWTLAVANPGLYWVQSSNMCGLASDSMTLTFYPVPQPDLGPDIEICFEEAYVLNAGLGVSYSWHDGSSTPTYDAWGQGDYWVVVANEYGCEVSDTVQLKQRCYPVVICPTAFTPNGDGLNDDFRIVTKHVTAFRIQVFDRWGTRIYEDRDIDHGWDGRYNKQDMPIGAYVYSVYYEDELGIPFRQSGNVTLLR